MSEHYYTRAEIAELCKRLLDEGTETAKEAAGAISSLYEELVCWMNRFSDQIC